MYITNISKDNSGSFSLNSQNENAKNNYIIPNTNHNLILPNHLKHILDNFNKESKAMQLNDNSLQEKNNKPSIFQSILSLKKANTHRVTKSIPRNEFSFQPTLIKSKLFKTNSFSKHNFLQRQEEYSKKLANKKEKMTEEHFNYVTNNLNNKHTKKISLNEFVEHCDRNLAKHNQLKETLMSKYYPDSGWNVMDNQNPNSLRILLEVYKKTFEKLFQILDFDEDGLISPFTISKSIKSLDKNIQKIISPITSELIEENYTLSKNEFVSALFELNKDLTLEQKNALLNFYYKVSKKEESIKKNKNDNNFSHLTFKPQINQRSRSIAGKYENRVKKEMEKRNLSRYSAKNDKKTYSIYQKKAQYFNNYKKTNNSPSEKEESRFKSIHNFTFDNYKNSI